MLKGGTCANWVMKSDTDEGEGEARREPVSKSNGGHDTKSSWADEGERKCSKEVAEEWKKKQRDRQTEEEEATEKNQLKRDVLKSKRYKRKAKGQRNRQRDAERRVWTTEWVSECMNEWMNERANCKAANEWMTQANELLNGNATTFFAT